MHIDLSSKVRSSKMCTLKQVCSLKQMGISKIRNYKEWNMVTVASDSGVRVRALSVVTVF